MVKYSAVIFDLDGTIVDNEADWKQAYQNVAKRHGIKKEIKLHFGRASEQIWKMNGEEEKADTLARESREEFMEIIEDKDYLEPREGFDQLITYLKEKGYVIGLASSSHWPVVDLELEKLGITGVFETMTTGEEVLRSKPDPEIFILTCQKMGVDPEETIVFEDSEAGIQAASDAGCKVIQIGGEVNAFTNVLEVYKEAML